MNDIFKEKLQGALQMNRLVVFVLIISSIACAENGFWKEFDCPNKRILKNIIDTSFSAGKCENSLCSYKMVQHRIDTYVCGTDTSTVFKDVFISIEPKFSGKCKKEKGNLRLTEEGACIISYGSKEEYFFVKRCGKDFCIKK